VVASIGNHILGTHVPLEEPFHNIKNGLSIRERMAGEHHWGG
jgi:hypothetical protein